MFTLLLWSIHMKSQSIDISFSLIDSCINIYDQTNAIQIAIQNNANKDIWVDLEAIRFEIHLEGEILTPVESTTIGVYSPKEQISKEGFVLVKKASNVLIISHSSLFRNYQLIENREYCLKGFYKDARNKKFRMIYNSNIDIGKNVFRICEMRIKASEVPGLFYGINFISSRISLSVRFSMSDLS